jgi:hypothetical protein
VAAATAARLPAIPRSMVGRLPLDTGATAPQRWR